jgi:hypothetical protein
MRLTQTHSDWVLGFADEVWWSRLAQPDLHAWACDTPLRLREMILAKEDTEPKAVACYGILRADIQEVLVRFVDGRPVSHVTTAFLLGVCEQLSAAGRRRCCWSGTMPVGISVRKFAPGLAPITGRPSVKAEYESWSADCRSRVRG